MSGKLSSYQIGYPGSRHGLMICATCRKPVNPTGTPPEAFAVRETQEAYIVQHRLCLPGLEDLWTKYDRKIQREQAVAAEFKAECQAFYAKWGVSDFTDEISD